MSKLNNRKWVKKALITFMTLLLLLTFFSNTLLSFSLAEATTSTATSGTLTESLRRSATAVANDIYEVTLNESREIAEVLVSQGEAVQAGDVLFTLVDQESEDVAALQSELNLLEYNHARSLLQMTLTDDAMQNTAVKEAREDLAEATAQRSALGTSTTTVMAAAAKVSSAGASVDTWQAKANKLTEQISQISQGDGSYSGIRAETQAVSSAEIALASAEAEVAKIQRKMGGLILAEFYAQIAELEQSIAALKQELTDLEEGGSSVTAISAKKRQLQSAQGALETAYGHMDDMLTLQDELTKAENQVSTCQTGLEQAQLSLQRKQNSVTAALLPDLDTAQANLGAATEALTAAQQLLETEEAILSANAAVTLASRALVAALQALSSEQSATAMSQKLEALDQDYQSEQIADMTEKLEKLEAEKTGTEVTAKYGGVVKSINVAAGKTAAAEEALADIEVTDGGCIAQIGVSKEDAGLISVGDAVDVTASSYTRAIAGTVTKIVRSTGAEFDKLVTVELDGDVEIGDTVAISVPISEGSYACIVPIGAVGEDANGPFVLTTQTKKTPLGDRYVVVRTSVSLEAENERSAAVSGLTAGTRVITEASRTVESSDYIRLAE